MNAGSKKPEPVFIQIMTQDKRYYRVGRTYTLPGRPGRWIVQGRMPETYQGLDGPNKGVVKLLLEQTFTNRRQRRAGT